jgi:hypothetical protein
MNVGVDVGNLVGVGVVWGGRSQVDVNMVMLTLGEVVVQ